MRRDTRLDLGVGQKLTTTNAPSTPFFSMLQGERVAQTDLASKLNSES